MTGRVIGVLAGGWLLVSLSLWAGGWEPAVLVLGGIVVAGGVVTFVVVELVRRVRPAPWPRHREQGDAGRRHRERVQVLAGDLYRSDWTDTADIRATLLDVMDDRLVAEYGVDRRADPGAAATLLSPRLRQLAAGPSRRLARANEIRSILSDIEAL